MSNNRRTVYLSVALITVIIVTVVVITAGIIMWFKPSSAKEVSGQSVTSTTTKVNDSMSLAPDSYQPINDSDLQRSSNFVTGLERLPKSLQGVEVDGEIIIDENKQLVVTEGLRRLFDYFLSAIGEEEEATILWRVESYIRHHTPEPAASQAVQLFGQYVAYLKALPAIEQRYGNLQLQATKNGELDLNVVAQQRQDVAKLREQYFDQSTISAFFGAEDDYDDYSIEMIRITQNAQLSDVQKQAAREDYISRLPESTVKDAIVQQANLGELMARTEQMKARGASPEALYQMRRELVGAPAAARLAQVDQEDADFDQRFTQYNAQKQQLLNQVDDQARAQTQINQLEQQLFSETERKRLTGYAALQQTKTQ